ERLVALGRLLAGDEAAADLVAPLGDLAGASGGPADTAPDGRPLRIWKWVALGGGVAAVAAGATLIAIHERGLMEDGSRNPSARNTRTAGIVSAAAGGLLIGAGVVMLVLDRPGAGSPERSAAVVPVDGGAAFVVAGRF
ncbi:MAG TPA: hypothetical protein VKZ63_19360, partial [Kofleriaceae bacterium]|nr:hypothetical protein [Kofleriaceae bacterium]